MAFPADRFRPAGDDGIPLQLPPSLAAATDPILAPAVPPPVPIAASALAPVDLAVEIFRVVPASGNLGLGGQQFWLGPAFAGRQLTVWADTTVVHLMLDGVRLKTVPSRFSLSQLQQLLADGGRPAGPPPVSTGPALPGDVIEVDRTIGPSGLLGLAGRQHLVGYHLAGRRVIARLDHGVLHLLDLDRTLLRSLPNPLTAAELKHIRGARPAGPAPIAPAGPLRADRRVGCRGSICIARQKIHVGIGHADHTVTVEEADTTFRVYLGNQLLTEVLRTTTKTIARFKARKPEQPRQASTTLTATEMV